MQPATIRTMASVVSLMVGLGTVSTRTSPAPYINVARMLRFLTKLSASFQSTPVRHFLGVTVDQAIDRTPFVVGGSASGLGRDQGRQIQPASQGALRPPLRR